MKKSLTLVAGLGQTGYAVARYLKRNNLPFVVFDTRRNLTPLQDFSATFPGVEVYLGDFPASLYGKLTQIIASPGLSLEEPFLEQARRHNIPIIGDIECFAKIVKTPIVAITGTNGKSTVTTLVGEMAKAAGMQVAVCGNIGVPILDLCGEDMEKYNLWVIELSSFQLDLTFSLSPKAATILNITPDHLDRHHNMENYTAAKQRVYHDAEYAIYNREDKLTYPSSSSHRVSFGLDKPKKDEWGIITEHDIPYFAKGDTPVFPTHALKLQGKHNWQNVLASCALADKAGIPIKAICHALETFSGLEHRCQTVRAINGVTYINDSKGTNIGATISAIEGIAPTITGKIVLIAGGLGKGADFTELKPAIKKHVKTLILIGQDAPLIEKAVATAAPILHAKTFEEAVLSAHQAAQKGDVVLLSPACASMDMFKDYVHRGNVFKELVNKLP